MRSAFPHAWIQKPLIRLALATLIGAVVGWRTEAVAASVSESALSGVGTDPAPHHCKCGRGCRGESCCCSPKKTKTRSIAQPSPKVLDSPKVAVNPCMKAAPCGESGAPPSPSVEPVGRAALFTEGRPFAASMSKRFAAVPTSIEAPARRADRLDDPPEPPAAV